MHKTLALGVLLVFALSVKVLSENRQPISTSETETISAAGTPQVTSVSPKANTPKAPVAPKAPQENPALVAAKRMIQIANQMRGLYTSYEKEYFKIKQDPVYQNPHIKAKMGEMEQPMQAAAHGTEALAQTSGELINALRQVLKASKTN